MLYFHLWLLHTIKFLILHNKKFLDITHWNQVISTLIVFLKYNSFLISTTIFGGATRALVVSHKLIYALFSTMQFLPNKTISYSSLSNKSHTLQQTEHAFTQNTFFMSFFSILLKI